MQLTVKGKQLDVGDALRTHVAESLEAVVGKYFNSTIVVHAGRNIMLHSAFEATEAYPAFDQACERIAKRLRRYKRRLREKHPAGEAEVVIPARYQILEAEPEAAREILDADDGGEAADSQPVVVAEMETQIDTLTVSEAVMRLELSERPALMFRNRGTGGLNLVYRRKDGHIGWVDPRGEGRAAA
jgi:ribosome-associated translation inhibitor RaiA